MEPIPVRDLGKLGILKDIAPFDLPMNAWSDGGNVIFPSGRVTSAPIARVLTDVSPVDFTEPPVFCALMDSANGYDPILVANRDYTFNLFQNNTITDCSPAGNTPASSDARFNSAFLAGLGYINRGDRVPLYYNTLTGLLTTIPAWDATHRCQVFRSFKDFAMALNVTKGATAYPTMLKWSNATESGATPPDFDNTSLSSLAGENVFSEATSQIVDGVGLRNDFIVYTQNESFVVEYIGGNAVFAFRRLFTDQGMLAQNCAVEVDGKHYVFGRNDIYMHDGQSKLSIVDGKNKNEVFNKLDYTKSRECFVFHFPKINCVFFCYPSNTSTAYYKHPTHCNRAMVFDYVSGAISFVDLPNVSSECYANVQSKATWASLTQTWDNFGGQWIDQDDDTLRHCVLTSVKSEGLTASRLIGLDDLLSSKINKPSSPEMRPPAFVERSGMTLTQLGIGLEARNLSATMFPLVQSGVSGQGLTIRFGRSDVPDAQASEYNATFFDPKISYKVDSRNTGRFLFQRFDFPVEAAVLLSGYDLDFKKISGR